MSKTKLLVLDSERDIRLLYKKEFYQEGYDVITAQKGIEAVEKTLQFNPDVVVMDIKLPGEDGIKVMDNLIKIKRTLPIVINTRDNYYKTDFKTWLAKSFITKSRDLKELKTEISHLVDNSQKL